MDANTRRAYYDKMTAQLEEWEARLGVGKASLKKKVADARIDAGQHSDELDRRHHALQDKLAELRETADDKWETVKAEVEQRWNAFSDFASRKSS